MLEELRTFAPVEGVIGNNDDEELRALLPLERVVEVDERRIAMAHVAGPRRGREERLLRRFQGCDAVVYGHSHVPQVERVRETWILNPGSPTERRRAPVRSMLVLEVDGRGLRPRLIELP